MTSKFLFTISVAITLLFLTTSAQIFAKDEVKGYEIELQIKGAKDTVCYLAYHYGKKILVQDTFNIDSKGRVFMKGETPLQGGIYIVIVPGNGFFEFLANGEENHFSLATDTTNYIMHMQVKGSKENKWFNQYQRFLKPRQDSLRHWGKLKQSAESEDSLLLLDQQLEKVNQEISDFRKEALVKQKGSFYAKLFATMNEPQVPDSLQQASKKQARFQYFRQHFWDEVDFSDERFIRTPILHNKIDSYLDKLHIQIPDSLNKAADLVIDKAKQNDKVFKYVLTLITSKYEQSKIMGHDAIFVHLADRYYLTGKADWMEEKSMKKIRERVMRLKPNLIGKKAPEISLPDSTGKKHSLYAIDADFTIVYFWSYSCGHCKKSLPGYKKIYDTYKDKGVQYYSVCTKPERAKWLKYLDTYKLDWLNVYDPDGRSPFRMLYDIHSTPTVYLLDKDKKILAKRVGPKQLENILTHYMNEDKKKD